MTVPFYILYYHDPIQGTMEIRYAGMDDLKAHNVDAAMNQYCYERDHFMLEAWVDEKQVEKKMYNEDKDEWVNMPLD